MKINYFIQIIVLLLTTILISQNSSENRNLDSLFCVEAKTKANSDLKNGDYKAYLIKKDKGHSKTFERILQEEYGIKILLYQSCFEEVFLECYSEISVPIIKAKFGKNIFEETKLKAIKLDESGKGERRVKFPNGRQELISFIYCHLDDKLLKQYKSKNYPIPKITLYISEKGKVYDQNIEFCDDEIIINEIKRIVGLIPKFEYATTNGKPIKSKEHLSIHFHKKWKRKTCR